MYCNIIITIFDLLLSWVDFINILRSHFLYESASLDMFQLCNFWRKNISAKCACKMLMKLTTAVNFIKDKQAHFSYERCFASIFYIHVTRKSCQNDIYTKNSRVLRWWNWREDEICFQQLPLRHNVIQLVGAFLVTQILKRYCA